MSRPVRNWEDLKRNLQNPNRAVPAAMIVFLWALLGFNPWVGFGLMWGVFGTLGIIGNKKDYDKYQDQQEYDFTFKAKQNSLPEPEKPNETIESLHLQVIKDAAEDFAIIKAASSTASGSLGENLRSMTGNITNIENGLIKAPNQLSNVQRLFTYYIPATADLLNARGVAVNNNDEAKITEIDSMVARLKLAFDDYLLRLNGQDKKSVDIDLKLLEQSLAQEFTHIDISKVK